MYNVVEEAILYFIKWQELFNRVNILNRTPTAPSTFDLGSCVV